VCPPSIRQRDASGGRQGRKPTNQQRGRGCLFAPLPLVNGHYLFLYHLLGLRRKEEYLATLEYRYTDQRTPSDESWSSRRSQRNTGAACRILLRDERGEGERLAERETTDLPRGHLGDHDVTPLDRPLEDRSRMLLRRHSPPAGAGRRIQG
jgi:hypothetical protein